MTDIQGGYSIESLLTQFQYFTQVDCTLVTHTVGPVAVGGTLTANGITLGEGGHNASYANKLGGTDYRLSPMMEAHMAEQTEIFIISKIT